jgi:hypothetical protein
VRFMCFLCDTASDGVEDDRHFEYSPALVQAGAHFTQMHAADKGGCVGWRRAAGPSGRRKLGGSWRSADGRHWRCSCGPKVCR